MTHPCPSLAKWFISNVMLLMQCRWYPTSIWPFPFKVKQKLLDLFIWAWPASSEVADSYRCPYNHYIPSRYCCNPMAVAERWLWYYTVRACKHVSSTGIKLSKVVLSHRDTVSEAQTLGMRWDVLHMYWSYMPSPHRKVEWQKGKWRNFKWRSQVIKNGRLFSDVIWLIC